MAQYCNMLSEWERKGITVDTASESMVAQIQELRDKVLEQSGLDNNELTLIATCRCYRIFKKVNVYAKRQIDAMKGR